MGKKWKIAACGLWMAASTATAWAHPDPKEMMERRIERRVEHMDKTLDLTDEQKTQVEKILRTDMEERHSREEALRKEINAVLSEEQLKKFEEKRSRGGKMGRGKHDKGHCE